LKHAQNRSNLGSDASSENRGDDSAGSSSIKQPSNEGEPPRKPKAKNASDAEKCCGIPITCIEMHSTPIASIDKDDEKKFMMGMQDS